MIFFHDDARIELAAALEDTETAAELVEKDGCRPCILTTGFLKAMKQRYSSLWTYMDMWRGTYTIFPERVQETAVENGKQLSLFDWMESDIQDKKKKKKSH